MRRGSVGETPTDATGTVALPKVGKDWGYPSRLQTGLAETGVGLLNGTSIMLIVHVHVQVKAEWVEAFQQATVANARESVKEPGIARFDCLQQADDPTRFVLVEAYRDAEAPARHKETKHYQGWRDAVAPMMAEPRASVKFANLFPDDKDW